MLARKMIIGMVVAVLVLMGGAARGTTYYVDPNGNDACDCSCWDNACATIQKGIDVASSGDVVEVNEGTYQENIAFDGNSITLRSVDVNDFNTISQTVIEASDANLDVVTFNSGEDSNTLLVGFTITGGEDGVSCSNSSSPVISKCIINNNSSRGVYSSSSAPPTVENCWIYGNYKGIEFGSASSAGVVRNNTIADNTTSGIYVGSGTAPTISNCIVWDCNDDLYDCDANYSCIEDGNAGTGNISSYPYFADYDGNDFHLTFNSPCINRGDPCFADCNETDIDGEGRVAEEEFVSERVDMGADEFNRHNINLVKNPGFEDGVDANGTPLNWIDKGGQQGAWKSIDPNEKHSGNYSWKFARDGNDIPVGHSESIGVEPGNVYKVSAWVKSGAGNEEGYLGWEEYDANEKPFSNRKYYFVLDKKIIPEGWTEIQGFYNVRDPNAAFVQVRLIGPAGSTTGTIWWDDFRVSEQAEFVSAFGCVNEPNLAETVEFGGDDKNVGWVRYYDSNMSDKAVEPNDNNITYRELLAGKGIEIEFPAFNIDPNYDVDDPNDSNSFPVGAMLLEIMYKDTVDDKTEGDMASSEDLVVVASKIDYIDLDPNYLIESTDRDYQIAHVGGVNDGRWKYLQYAFQKSDYQLLRAIDADDDGGGEFTIKINNKTDANLPIDYVSMRAITPEEYEAMTDKQREVRNFYEAELPADAGADQNYTDPDLVVFVRDIMRPVYKHTKPDANEPNSITAFSCWGEVEPVSFSIYSQDGVDVNITVSNLTHADGNTIDGNDIEIYRVVYDEARLTWLYNANESKGYALLGDRLEKFTTLSIDANSLERIWLKIEVPSEDAGLPSGLYEGNVKIERAVEADVNVPIELTVYEIDLVLSEHINPVYHDPYFRLYSSDSSKVFEAYSETGFDPFICSVTYRIHAEPNDPNDSPPIGPNDIVFDSNNFEVALDRMIDEGVAQELVVATIPMELVIEIYGLVGLTGNFGDLNMWDNLSEANFVTAFGSLIEKYKSIGNDANRDIIFIFNVVDEPWASRWLRIYGDRLYTIIHDPNGPNSPTCVTYSVLCDESCTPGDYNVPTTDGNIPPLTDLVDYKLWSTGWADEGYAMHQEPNYHGYFGYYTTGQSHFRDPIYNRFLHGLFAFGTDSTAVAGYAMGDYRGDPFNDFDPWVQDVFPFAMNNFLYAYPTWSGELLYTIGGLEGIREGIKDARYIATLKNAINDSNTPAPLAGAAQDYLDDVKGRMDPNYRAAYYDEDTGVGYYKVILEDISETNDPNDFEAFTKIRQHIADYIVWVNPNAGYRVHNVTQDTWYKTINDAIDGASSGDIIAANQGRYYETVDFNGLAITLRGSDVNDWGVVAATIIDANGGARALDVDTNSTISGLTITGGTYGVYCDSASPTISKCIIDGNSTSTTGIYCSGGGPEIINNKICDNGSYGVYSDGSSAEFKNNWIYRNGDEGMRFDGTAGVVPLVRNDTIAYNTNHGIYIAKGKVTEPTVSNCILWDNNDDLDGCDATYSCIKDSDSGTGNINGDSNNPSFVDGDGNDYHLDMNSPCIDVGDDGQSYTGETDIDGELRVVAVVDMGADETYYPVSWWKFDEGTGSTAYDSSRNNHGSVYYASWTTGQIDGALEFGSTYDYVDVGDLDDLDFGASTDFTLSAWFQTSSSSAQMIVNKKEVSTTPGYDVYVQSGEIYARIGEDGEVPVVAVSSGEDFDDGSWHHMAAVFDRDDVITVYVDANDVATSASISGIDCDTGWEFFVGNRNGNSVYFNGKIDDVRVYNRALSDEEVLELYEDGSGG